MPLAKKPSGSLKLQPPMTPMIDCIFQLLLFFLLVPSLAADEGYLTTNLPREGMGPGPRPVREAVRIGLEAMPPDDERVAITLNDRVPLGDDFEGLRRAMEALQAQGLAPDQPVLIAPTQAVRHRWVVRAMDTAVAARFRNIQFAVSY